MPGGSTQPVKFSDNLDWLCSGMSPRPDLETVPFVGDVGGVPPPLWPCDKEVRRRDVGAQRYGSGIPTFNNATKDRNGLVTTQKSPMASFDTMNGKIALPAPPAQSHGHMPTADVLLFLKHEYTGSRAIDPPPRYYK